MEQVTVTDIKMSFSSMVVFMIKWAIASVPAIIILAMGGLISFGLVMGIIQAW